MSIHILASLRCNKDAEVAFETELKKLVNASAKEEGCIRYELYQYNQESLRYVLQEEWHDDVSLAQHMETPHYKYFIHIAPVLLAQPPDIEMLTRLL